MHLLEQLKRVFKFCNFQGGFLLVLDKNLDIINSNSIYVRLYVSLHLNRDFLLLIQKGSYWS